MDLNKAMIIGRLTRDPELRTTGTGQNVASFSIATNFAWTDQSGQKQEKVEFHNIVVWRKLAEICAQYLRKGARIYVEGRLQTREWTGQDNSKRYTTEIIADNMIMLDSKGFQANAGPIAPYGNQNNTQNNFQARQQPAQAKNNNYNEPPIIGTDEPTSQPTNQYSNPDEDEVRVEDIPF